ncbi:MAG: Gfo/Idh/MocA family oxidoreductase [Pseudomonadales bacterium]|nr:Gfo/Idh/MocA family oxidoreductase [Pseudomonadales bacterium]
MLRFFDESAAERSARVEGWTAPSETPRFRFLIIGTGMIGREHIGVTELLGQAVIHGIYDPHQPSIDAALDLFAHASEQPRVYESLQSALADPEIDAIFLCTPNFTHFELIQQLIETGRPLFIEKPMATRLADAAELLKLETTYSAPIQIGMQYRYKSQYTEAFRQVKHQYSLGDVKTVSMSEYRPPFLNKVNQWNKFNEYSGGTLVEKCCHYFDLINLMAESRPHSVYATGGQAVNFLDFKKDGKNSDIHDHGFVIINYENGVHASFALNMFSEELYEELIVGGSKGRLIATESSSFKRNGSSVGRIKVEVDGHEDYDFRDTTYPAIIESSGHHGATFFEHEAFIAKLEGKPSDGATIEQGWWAMLVASAAQESIAQGKEIRIADFLSDNGLDIS